MHALLARQLRKFDGSPESPPVDWGAFLRAIDEAYAQADADRQLLERSIDLVSQELLDRSSRLEADVLERTMAEQALCESQARMRAIFDALPDTILRVARSGEILDLFAAKGSARALFDGCAVGRAIADCLPHEVAAAWLSNIDAALRTGVPQMLESSVPGLDGTRHFETRLAVSGEDEVVAVVRDTTAVKRIQEQLRISDQMISLGTLAAGVAHEINNPLAYVVLNLGFVMSELKKLAGNVPGPVVEELITVVGEAQEGAERVRDIVRDLKAFTREAGETTGPADLHRSLETAVQMTANEVRHRAHVVKEYGPVPLVKGSPGRIVQVLVNLVVNAAQAMDEGRRDQNALRLVTRTDERGFAVVEVHDTGRGIAPDVLGRIFEPFFTTKPVGSGTGLGLYVCHNIVSAMGGTIVVESTQGVGTCVRVSLPSVTGDHVAREAAKTTRPPSSRRASILVIDDEPLVTRSVRRVLPEHHVTELHSGREALEVLRSGRRFDLVLCDLMMPDLTGMDVYERVREEWPGLEQHIVFMTGGTFTARARQFLETVSNARIDKPFDAAALRALLDAPAKAGAAGDEPR